MQRPKFTPEDIGVTVPDATGAVVLHLRDAKGNDQLVPLTAGLRANLGQRLISEPLAENQSGKTLFLSPSKTRAYAKHDGEFALELQLESGRAVHVLLRGLHADALALQIQEIRSTPSGGGPSNAAH